MARVNEAEKEILRQAAESAKTLLPKLFQDKAKLEQRIVSLQAVVVAWETMTGRRSKNGLAAVMETIKGEKDSALKSQRAKRGQVLAHIDAVLKDGGTYDEPQIRERIFEQFQIAYGRSTVYSTLRRLKWKKYEYNDEKKTWRLKEA